MQYIKKVQIYFLESGCIDMGGKACIKIATPERCSKNRIIQRRCMKSCDACRKYFIQYLGQTRIKLGKNGFIFSNTLHTFSNFAEPPAGERNSIDFHPSNNERKYFIK